MLVAATCRIQRWPTNLMKMKRICFRRNAFQPFAPGLPATPSSHKRPPPVLPPGAVNLEPLLQRCPKKPLQQWSGFVDSRLAPIRAPFRGKVCKTGSATSRVVFRDRETIRPKAHRIMTTPDRGWRKSCPWSARNETQVHQGCLLIPPETAPSRKKSRIPVSSVGGPGHRHLLLWFPGNPRQEDRRTTKSVMLTTPSAPLQHLEFQKPTSGRSRWSTTFPPSPDEELGCGAHDRSGSFPIPSTESSPKRGFRFEDQARSKWQSSRHESLYVI